MTTFENLPPNRNQETASESTQDSWERNVLQDLAFAAIKEQRAKRLWGYVFKGLILLYLVAVLLLSSSEISSQDTDHTALVDITGIIAADTEANADIVITGIRDAFQNPQAKALILRLNTPGGSPVQAGIINDEIKRLKQTRTDFPVYAVVQDVCASGGYYIAVAADEIYADKASIVGSIGVRMDGFGFTEAIDKLGIERRSLTAGEHKAFLDPFLPVNEADVRHANEMLNNIHQQFIDVVKKGRGKRLKENEQLFSGLFWSGEQALSMGLIDGLASSGKVAREMAGYEEIIDYTLRPDYFEQIVDNLGASIGNALITNPIWNLR